MASTGKSAPQKLSLPQLTGIHQTHPEIGKSLQAILDYINTNVDPKQGNKVAPR